MTSSKNIFTMAIFQFQGDPAAFGKPILKIRVNGSNGVWYEYAPPDTVSWKAGDNLPNITDPHSIEMLTIDTRYILV